MSGSRPKKPVKPPERPPRKGRPREPEDNVSVTPINPPAVGGGGIQRGERGTGPRKK
jgi:hypothetical protein